MMPKAAILWALRILDLGIPYQQGEEALKEMLRHPELVHFCWDLKLDKFTISIIGLATPDVKLRQFFDINPGTREKLLKAAEEDYKVNKNLHMIVDFGAATVRPGESPGQ